MKFSERLVGPRFNAFCNPRMSFEEFKERAVREIYSCCGGNAELGGHGLTTKEGYNVKCSTLTLNDLTWRIEMMDQNGSSYLYLADGTHVDNIPIDVLKSVRLQMMKRLSDVFFKDHEYIQKVKNAKSRKEIEDLEIDYD